MKQRVLGYKTPGFFLNLPFKVESFGYFGDYWRSADIIEVSENAYSYGEQTAPFIKIRTEKGLETWVFGGDVIVAATDSNQRETWYYSDNNGYNYLQVFYIEDQFYFKTTDRRLTDLDDGREPDSDNPLTRNMPYKTSSSRYTATFDWDFIEGCFKYRFIKTVSGKKEERTSEYALNFTQLKIKKTMQTSDEWFWHYFINRDFDALLDLKARGYDKYDSPYIDVSESPFFISLDNRDFEMLKFLIENGFSQTVYGGNYDATVSCLWDPINNDDYEMVDFLLDHGVKKDQGGELGTEWDLGFAIGKSTPEMVKLLIDHGYDASQPVYSYSNGEDSGSSSSFFYSALYNDDIDKIKILINAGANVNFLAQQYNFHHFSVSTPLDNAKSNTIKELLISHGARRAVDLTLDDYKKQGLGLSGKVKVSKVPFKDSPGMSGIVTGYAKDNENLIVLNITSVESVDNPKEISMPWFLVRRDTGEFVWIDGQYVEVNRTFRSY